MEISCLPAQVGLFVGFDYQLVGSEPCVKKFIEFFARIFFRVFCITLDGRRNSASAFTDCRSEWLCLSWRQPVDWQED
jgi:hypothetical protein